MALVLIALLAGCGGSSAGGTSYWKANFTNGTSQYISVVISGQNVSGWAQYGDGTFTHYDGQVNSDGTLDVTAYAGSTLSINGNSLTASLNGEGDVHFTKVAESAYKSAGGTE